MTNHIGGKKTDCLFFSFKKNINKSLKLQTLTDAQLNTINNYGGGHPNV